MPSFQDSAVIFFIALLLFGPKKLPELARQLGKLMGEFRRASNEFRMQMEDELRVAEQAEQQKKIAAMEAAAPVSPAISDTVENTIGQPTDNFATDQNYEFASQTESAESTPATQPTLQTEPLPIATAGGLNLMPPSTGLPVPTSSMSHAFDSIPQAADPETVVTSTGNSTDEYALAQMPDRTREHPAEPAVDHITSEAPLHG
jgi:sec-independent protein translocase protein TatB